MTWSFLRTPTQSLVIGLAVGFSLSLSLSTIAYVSLDAWKRSISHRDGDDDAIIEIKENDVADGVEGLIGNTPMVRIKSLSDMTGVEIYGKCEFLNPFGSVKDRVSLKIIQDAEEQSLLHPYTNSCIFEGTSGSTGISISGIARSRGYKSHIVLSDDVAKEKVQLLEAYGAEVERVRPVSIVDKNHYVNLARKRALEFGSETIFTSHPSPSPSGTTTPSTPQPSLLVSSQAPFHSSPTTRPPLHKLGSSASSVPLVPIPSTPPQGLFADQFSNLLNVQSHYESTGPEIWRQCSGNIDCFISGAGTGGTIAGVGRYLKEVSVAAKKRGEGKWHDEFGRNGHGHGKEKKRPVARKGEGIRVVLADPQGSGLFHKVHDGVMYSQTEAEGKRRRYQVDTVVEGIGLNRITKNLAQALPFIDDAYRVTDAEAVAMSRHLATVDGLFLGSSSAVNLVASLREAKKMEKGKGKTIVTILCDSGQRHLSRFWNDEYLMSQGIPVSADITAIWGNGVAGEAGDETEELGGDDDVPRLKGVPEPDRTDVKQEAEEDTYLECES